MNSILMKNLRRIPVPGTGPEDVLLDQEGSIFTGLKDNGTILRLDSKSGRFKEISKPGGSPLGLEWLPDGRILVCNAAFGLQAIDVSTGQCESLDVKGVEFTVCNNAHVIVDGSIFVSDSSLKYSIDQYSRDIIENSASGRLIKISANSEAHVVLSGLSFANGVAVLPDNSAILVAETAQARIKKVMMDGSGVTTFAETPGLPDNISAGSDGKIWVAIPSLLNETLAKIHAAPLIFRRVVASLPKCLQPKASLCCRVAVYHRDGGVPPEYCSM